jgi:hypothetical protein
MRPAAKVPVFNPSVQQNSFHRAVAMGMAECATPSVGIVWCTRRQSVGQDFVPILVVFVVFFVFPLERRLLLIE